MTAANSPSKRCSHTGPCNCPPEGYTLNRDNLTPAQLTQMVNENDRIKRELELTPAKPGCAPCGKGNNYVPATHHIRDIPLCDICFRRWHQDEERALLRERRRFGR